MLLRLTQFCFLLAVKQSEARTGSCENKEKPIFQECLDTTFAPSELLSCLYLLLYFCCFWLVLFWTFSSCFTAQHCHMIPYWLFKHQTMFPISFWRFNPILSGESKWPCWSFLTSKGNHFRTAALHFLTHFQYFFGQNVDLCLVFVPMLTLEFRRILIRTRPAVENLIY